MKSDRGTLFARAKRGGIKALAGLFVLPAALLLPLSAGADTGGTSAAAATASAKIASQQNPGITFDRKLTPAYLRAQQKEVGKPLLTVGRYSTKEGLVAAYQSESGKRIMFAARYLPNGKVVAQVLHKDPVTNAIVPLAGKSKGKDANGLDVRDIEVGGVGISDMLKTLKLKKGGDKGAADKNKEHARKLKKFLQDDTGQALLDGLPALYSAVEDMESAAPEAGRGKLLAPFGAIGMAVQVGADHQNGFRHADRMVGKARAQMMRDSCAGISNCAMRGKSFMVHSSGLFDVLSNHKAAAAPRPIAKFPAFAGSSWRLPVASAEADSSLFCDDSTNDCFGACGPGCIAPGCVRTEECNGHDSCVEQYGHLSCMVSVPDDCIGCYDLIDAIGSYVDSLIDSFFDFLGDIFGGGGDDMSYDMEEWMYQV